MKAKALLLILASGSVVAACSSDDVSHDIDSNDSRAIKFAAQAPQTRADVTTANLTTFNVSAFTDDGKEFMDNVIVTRDGTKWVYSPVQYWPTKALDFYSWAPADWITNGQQPNGPVDYANNGYVDIVYATSMDRTQPTDFSNAQVKFNFRHALSKVDFWLSSTESTLQVKVSKVTLVGINTRGTFNFPTASTDVQITQQPDSASIGTWTGLNTQYAYITYIAQDNNDLLTLTTTPVNPNADGVFPQYMIPQPLTWRTGGTTYRDDYVEIELSVYDSATNERIWPNSNTPDDNYAPGSANGNGLIKFPLISKSSSEWLPGYHYIYNIVINANDEMGAIEFGSPTVDSYVDVTYNYDYQ